MYGVCFRVCENFLGCVCLCVYECLLVCDIGLIKCVCVCLCDLRLGHCVSVFACLCE